MESLASIFDGSWRSALAPNGDETPDGVFHIVVDPATNRLDPRSRHDSTPITGRVRRGTRFHAIIINEGNPPIRYKGSIVGEGATLTLSGFRDLAPTGILPEKNAARTEETEGEFLNQLQEVWVATKP